MVFNMLPKSVREKVSKALWSKPRLYGRIWIEIFEKQCPIGFLRKIEDRYVDNLTVNTGRASILKLFGNISGGGYLNSIGAGTSAVGTYPTDSDITGGVWKTVSARTTHSPAPFYADVSSVFGTGDANFVWKEFGLRDNNNVFIARQILFPTINKTSAISVTVHWLMYVV